MIAQRVPLDGIKGLKENWLGDMTSGFMVFLLALPLSLGIAKASEFPASMGVFTAMVGGMLVSIFSGSRLTIKGPAAGLITICSGCVMEFGGGESGWELALGVIVVASLFQMVFGFFKIGSLTVFFPYAAVHGMLAAIGLIIFSKQIHILLGIDPAELKGFSALELYGKIPSSIIHEDIRVTIIGIVSLFIIFGVPKVKIGILKKIPIALLVLLVTIPMEIFMDFKDTEPQYALVGIGDFWKDITFHADFSGISSIVFWKYVLMFLLVGSLESLLTVRAMDGLDPWKRESDPNKDLIAVGFGNTISSLFGGIPMISEVARSSANITFGARTRWSNFFHGFFLFVAMLFFIPIIELIPNSALAALLISVAYRLASPSEFLKMYKIGSEQLVIFLVTIITTLVTDLLIGIFTGVLIKFLYHLYNGVSVRDLFKPRYTLESIEGGYKVFVFGSAIFSNLIGYKKLFMGLLKEKLIIFDFSGSKFVDHSFMDALAYFESDFTDKGGKVSITGFDNFRLFSEYPTASRKYDPNTKYKIEIKLSERQRALQIYASENEYGFIPQKVKNLMKFRDFNIQIGSRISYEENVLDVYLEKGHVTVSDIIITEGVLRERNDTFITVLYLTELPLSVPDFILIPEGFFTKISEISSGKDIDFPEYPIFSQKYYLRGDEEDAINKFFDKSIITFFEDNVYVHMECRKNRVVIHSKKELLDVYGITQIIRFSEKFLSVLLEKK
ncbi:MAG: SulP family inorganic anion transporter [Chitinophagaceae bacterium]|nr:SulP family inorganic anion transporter [Chitinophagaceae bacterium]